MTDFDNTNSGAIFKNDNKESERHPDYKGSLNVDGVDHWVSSWIKVSKSGQRYMSLSVKPKDEQKAPSKPAKPAGKFEDMDDDVPF